MTPDLVLFGIKSIIRLAQQGDRAMIDYAVDKPVKFPAIKVLKFQLPINLINPFLSTPKFKHLTSVEPFKSVWNPTGGAGHKGAIDQTAWNNLGPEKQNDVYLAAIRAAQGDPEGLEVLGKDDEAKGPRAAEQMATTVLIKQWKPEDTPVSPFGRMALAVAEVGLDFVATDPGIFGAGNSGEKVISAFAIAFAAPISDNLDAAKLGTLSDVLNGVAIAFVRAGLDALKEHAGELVSDEHVAVLIGNVLDPLIAAAKENGGSAEDQVRRVVGALQGPAASAVMSTIAQNPTAFLGRNFDSSKAAGAVVSAVLVAASSSNNVRDVVFTDKGLLRLLSAALQVAADRPQLFIKVGEDKKKLAVLTNDLVTSLASELKTTVDALALDGDIDGRALAAGIAASAIGALGRNSDVIVGDATGEWHGLVKSLTSDVFGSLAAALKNQNLGPTLKKAFSEEKLIELGSIVVEGIAANPKLVGVSKARASEVVSAIATVVDRSMAGRKTVLLSTDDWLDLARSMVREVSARPGILSDRDTGLSAVAAAIGQILEGDKNALLSRANVTAMVDMLIVEVVSHSALVSGTKDEILVVAQALSKAMAADTNGLLSGEDWVQFLKDAASEATANAARLFAASNNTAAAPLAADMLSLVLRSLPQIPASGGGTTGLILKGDVIRDAMTIVLRYVSGAPDRAKKYQPLLQAAVTEISSFVADNSGGFGSKEWLRLIRVVSARIMDGEFDAQLNQLRETPPKAVKLIASVAAAEAFLRGSVS